MEPITTHIPINERVYSELESTNQHSGASTPQFDYEADHAESAPTETEAESYRIFCNSLTDQMAEKTKRAVDSGNMPEIIHRAMQLKNRRDEFEHHMYFLDGPFANAAMSVAMTGSGPAIAMTHTMAVGQGVLGAHLAVRTRSDNVYRMARQAIEESMGSEFANKIDALPYNKDGISKARSLLHEADSRYNALESDPHFNTKPLVRKELKKGGDLSSIQQVEFTRATGFASNAESSGIRRRNQ
jgi:hypothetical protein